MDWYIPISEDILCYSSSNAWNELGGKSGSCNTGIFLIGLDELTNSYS